jgi:hypothetical protein
MELIAGEPNYIVEHVRRNHFYYTLPHTFPARIRLPLHF